MIKPNLFRFLHCKVTIQLFVGLVFLCSCNQLLQAQSTRANPNIIVIYADDVGYGDIGAYGAKQVSTPAIDNLAENGLRFTNGYATAATCTPSRYSLLTGEYAFRNNRARILSGSAPLLIKPGSTTMATVLQQAGYKTSIVGKWHLGLGDGKVNWNEEVKPGPLEVGFDESFIMPATNDRVPTVYLNGHRVHNLSEEDKPLRISYQHKIGDLPTGRSHPELLRYPADGQHSGTIVNNISRIGWQSGGQSTWWKDEDMPFVWVEQSEKFIEGNRNNPFFLFLSLHEAHSPRAPHPKFLYQSDSGIRGDVIHEMDWIVKQVMNKLEKLNLRENTLVIFTSDNGPVTEDGYRDRTMPHINGHEANGPLRGGKYLAYEGGTRVPFIVSWPKGITPGTSDAIVSQVDLLASISDLTGVTLPNAAGADSRNLLSVLLGKQDQGREHVVQQSPGGLSIRKGKWKLIPAETAAPKWAAARHSDPRNPIRTEVWPDRDALYNLENDQDESENVAQQHPGKVKELRQLLEEIRDQ